MIRPPPNSPLFPSTPLSRSLAFYEFLASSLHAADRVRHAAEAYDRRQNALALATKLNPMATPEGTLDLGSYRLHWRAERIRDRKSTRLNSSHSQISYAVFCL